MRDGVLKMAVTLATSALAGFTLIEMYNVFEELRAGAANSGRKPAFRPAGPAGKRVRSLKGRPTKKSLSFSLLHSKNRQ
jgi:hypothetical protein